eukprot:13431214-Alexandrium_andersonii.AAC.1
MHKLATNQAPPRAHECPQTGIVTLAYARVAQGRMLASMRRATSNTALNGQVQTDMCLVAARPVYQNAEGRHAGTHASRGSMWHSIRWS